MAVAQQHTDSDIKTILSQENLDGEGDVWLKRIEAISCEDVEKALSVQPGFYDIQRLVTLISPAAEGYIEQMAQLARQLTIQRFGRTIRLYAPLYLSNYCTSSCRYCGFNRHNKFERKRLTIEQAVAEADIIAGEGFRDILLVSGEDRDFITVDYLKELARKLRSKFSSVSLEIYQMTEEQYAELFSAGIEGVTIYQETYNREVYDYYHHGGAKADYDYRLKAADSIARAKMREIGIGALLGLTNYKGETLALAEHVNYLIKRYWQCHVSVSFPRLRPAENVDSQQFTHLLSDKNLVQMLLALRLCFADVGLVLSTREPAWLRNHLVLMGITKMSAGSKTCPGGYSGGTAGLKQFEVDDSRTPGQIAEMLKQKGIEPVWKDWDAGFQTPCNS